MNGFPGRPSRSAFGPATLVDRFPPRDAEKELTAAQMMLSFWQLAGLGVVTARAVALFTGADPPVLIATGTGECWDVNGTMEPLVERDSAGVYVVTYPATVLDDAGLDYALDLVAAQAFAQSATPNLVAVPLVTSGRIITVQVTVGDTGAPFDPEQLLVVAR